MNTSARVAVVGAGISGLATALALADTDAVEVTVFEAADRVGGKIDASPFAGVTGVDEAADAFLARVPEAVALAHRIGLGDDLVSPEPVGAAVWHDGLQRIPDGLMLGLPGKLLPLATTGLLSWRGKARAAIEPFLPHTSTESDSIGEFVRARFGDEVHERMVDALVGSIYAADTDRFSLAEVPQLAALATGSRSVLLAARRQRRSQAGTATAAASPIFATPRGGIGAFARAAADAVVSAGGRIHTGAPVTSITPSGNGSWSLSLPAAVGSEQAGGGATFDAIVFATPAAATAKVLVEPAPDAAELLGAAQSADVIMVTLHVGSDQWPDRLHGLSGYLVPKPDQRWVTAASFASQKWGHWRPPAGGEILRVSIGRDGMEVMHLDDDEILRVVLDDLAHHLGVRFEPDEIRITRWPAAFAQYRPHHASWVDAVEDALPSGVFVTGAGFRGIGIPACIRAATSVAARASAAARLLAESP
ncbi:MAG TPA: protoporphyrinogen oxidase [Ilumatobacteraceae bacterium]|nr:protoporphyrinogen oxidase [Ilumatobacteraceae bacterium]